MPDYLYYIIFICIGFLSGSILFAQVIAKTFCKKDLIKDSSDGNPGTANVFMKCGVFYGILCLILELLKGFLPVFLFRFFVSNPEDNIWFFLIMIAPVIGSALGIFNKFKGGKCITVIFGVYLGVLPYTWAGFVLLGIYILYAGIIRIKPNRVMSIITFITFIILGGTYLTIIGKYNFLIGSVIMSLIAIIKHLKKVENINR